MIELLVVIAVIAVLAAVIFPVFAQTREKARQAACASNLSQLGKAMTMYTADYDEYYPTQPYSLVDRGKLRRVYWFDMIFPYVKNGGVYSCPSDPQSTDWIVLTNEPPERGGCSGGSRGVSMENLRFSGYSINRSLSRSTSLADVPRPSLTSVLFDGYPLCSGSPPGPLTAWIARPGGVPRHQEGLIVTYADSHTRRQKAVWSQEQDNWVVSGGPYDNRLNLSGIVLDDGTLLTQ